MFGNTLGQIIASGCFNHRLFRCEAPAQECGIENQSDKGETAALEEIHDTHCELLIFVGCDIAVEFRKHGQRSAHRNDSAGRDAGQADREDGL